MDEPIRVLCVFSTLDRGGAESMCMNLYRKIDRAKIQFDFMKHTSAIGAFEEEIKELGGRIYQVPEYKVINHISYCRAWKEHFKKHPEHTIVHGHYFTISAVYFRVAKSCGRITIGHIHATRVDSKLKSLYVKAIKYYTDYAIACSNDAGKWIYRNRPFKVFHNALDTETFRYNPTIRRAYRDKYGLNDRLVVGTVANFSKVKNPMGLIDIYLCLRKKVDNVKLLWIGEGGMRRDIEERIQHENIQDGVLLLGNRNDVSYLLQGMDFFLLPSFSEGLPLSVIEAQASGLVCLLSDRITRDIDITGLCRFLPIDKPDIWAEDILQAGYERDDTSEKLKTAGYDIFQTVRWLEGTYQRLMSSRNY